MLDIPPFCDGVIKNMILTDIIFTTGQGFVSGRAIGIFVVITLVSAQQTAPLMAYAIMLGSRDVLILLFLLTYVALISLISISINDGAGRRNFDAKPERDFAYLMSANQYCFDLFA